MLKIRLSSAAKQDMQEAAMYYNKQQQGLGRRFEKIIKSTIQRIQQMPESASFAFETTRYKAVDKFPFVILYQLSEKHIRIVRVFNTFQDDTEI